MSYWEEIRRAARAHHATALDAARGDPSSQALLAAAERLSGVARVPVPAGDALLDGADALLDVAAGLIVFAAGAEPWRAAFVQAHEYAHLWLDAGHASCTDRDMEVAASPDGPEIGPERVDGYGPRERRERAANVFALEFLLPCPLLRRWYLQDGLNAVDIAARTGLPESLVCLQLARALLLPAQRDEDAPVRRDDADVSAGPGNADVPVGPGDGGGLDDSQLLAAHAERGPLLLEAGPGTGKTRTLVARIVYLLRQGVPAGSILALTFSQRAAEELRSRVAAEVPDAAAALWLGTFHAFGLEVLRKHGVQLGLPPAPTVLDPLDALFWLERRLPELDLEHYLNLYDPALTLRDILGAISRAKDELIGPAEYRALVEQMEDAGASAADIARAREVARVYSFYQRGLERDGALDFGDLIARAVHLLREHPAVRDAVRRAYPHILVDEYQDVNRASGLLLRELAGDGAGLWVVGDARQAIYRFRGAAPANMRLFNRDYPAATVLELRCNYRSRPAIVRAVGRVAARMSVVTGAPAIAWTCRRAEGGEVRLEVAANEAAEIAGLSGAIREAREQGIGYADQAVLCRSHRAVERIGMGLEAAGIPVLNPGAVFERPEVRDMLALLSLTCDGDGRGLLRVARFAEYAIPPADVLSLLAWADAQGVRFPRALTLATDVAAISPRGQAGLAMLARHLDGLAFGADAWGLLARYLFARSDYLRAMMGDDAASAQRRLALYQLLQAAGARRGLPGEGDEDPKRAFLRYVRRLASLGEDRRLHPLAEGAAGIDAVRLLTIHAAKGLEFGAVYVPMLAQRHFPAPRKHDACPPPWAWHDGTVADEHDEEEECLFFVAASRARDVLCLSRARRYGRLSSKPSRLLDLLDDAQLVGPRDGPDTWPAAGLASSSPTGEGASTEASAPLGRSPVSPAGEDDAQRRGHEAVQAVDAEELELYLDCPRRYYYARELGLRRGDDGDAYAHLRRCVHDVLVWMGEQEAQGRPADTASAQRRLDELWLAQGSRRHPSEVLYRRAARAMIAHALAQRGSSGASSDAMEWELALTHGRVRLRPHRIESGRVGQDESIVVQQLRTGSGSGGERQKRLAALYQAGAAQAHPAARRRVQSTSLVTGAVTEIALDDATVATRLAAYDEALAGIERKDFSARPSDRQCPRCPYYFICPTAD